MGALDARELAIWRAFEVFEGLPVHWARGADKDVTVHSVQHQRAETLAAGPAAAASGAVMLARLESAGL